jgi:hypothetical protein
MQSSRRSFLKTSGLAALLGVVGTAGCLETVDDAVGGGPPDYANWLYDPAEVYDSDYVGFGTFDVQSVYENEDELPEGMMDQVEEVNEEADFVDLDAMENVTGIAYGLPNQDLGGGSMVVSGEFDVDAITAEIENEAPEEYETTTHGDFTLYTMTREHPAEDGPDTNSATVAVSGDHVLVGGMQAPGVTSADAVTTMIDAGGGDVPRLHEENEDADELVSQLGDATLVVGGTFDADLTNFTDDATPDEVVDAVDDLVAVGVASDVDGDSVEHTMALVYATEDDASTEDVEDALDRVEETNDPAGDQLEDRSVSRDGRAVLVSTTGETEALFEPFGLFGGGPTDTATASGSASESRSESVPQVRFDFQYRDDGKVEITHRSGDHVNNALHVRYQHDGAEVTESWSSSDAIVAGDRYVTQRAPDPGSKLLLVWVDGDRSAVLGSYVVPE